MRLGRLLAAGLLTLSFMGCAAETNATDEESEAEAALADGAGKEDALSSTSTYYAIRRDTRKCLYPMCGGYWAQRLNRAKAICADGSSAESCYVAELDQSALKIASADGASILRGKIAKQQINGSSFGVFKATEAWRAATEAAPTGLFYRVDDSGIFCVKAPCPSLHRAKLNSILGGNFDELDLTPSGATQDQIDEAMNAIFRSAVLIAGRRSGGKITASQLYTRTDDPLCAPVQCKLACLNGWAKDASGCDICACAPAPKPCFVGGCSGELCTDSPGALSTCQVRPEAICYKSASCAAKSDGACGWTVDAALTQCLASFPH